MESKCKICRRAGEKLFLKGERCFTAKCAVVRKPYPPGIHTRSRRRGLSEFGTQLKEKQKLRNLYHLRERQFYRYVKNAMKVKGADAGNKLLEALSLRLDNIVFQSGLAQSRSIARHMVSHGHARVNNRKTKVPSYAVHVGDVISLSDNIWKSTLMHNTEQTLKKHKPPTWIMVDANNRTATVSIKPDVTEQVSCNTKLIIEYYAR
jgi:small subunit ribosomal protein S4